MPIGRDHVGKRPFYPWIGDASDDSWIPIDVWAVVEINELVRERLAKNQPGQAAQEETNCNSFPPMTMRPERCWHVLD